MKSNMDFTTPSLWEVLQSNFIARVKERWAGKAPRVVTEDTSQNEAEGMPIGRSGRLSVGLVS